MDSAIGLIAAITAVLGSLAAWWQWRTRRRDGLADKEVEINEQIRRSNYWYIEHYHILRRICIENGLQEKIEHIPFEIPRSVIKGESREE